uniref:STAT transcription factor DNA-binding domain-containing protein n=1 Tax=Plectus sambesii TaxID=2011161 RepID=A0A914UPY0_9BILA
MEPYMPAFDANLFNIEQLDAVASQLQAQPQSYLPFHQYLPTLTQHLSQAVESLQRNQKKLLDEAIPGFYHMQRMEEISGSGETEIDQAIKRLSKEFPAHFNEISHLIKFGQRLQSLIQMGRQIQSCDPGIISALQGAFQVLPSMRATLISRSMLVTSQPNAVLKKGNLFSTEVRLLLDIAAASPTVRIRIIALSDAERLVAGAAQCNQVSYEATIVNNQATFEKKEDALISHFVKQPTLKEIGARGQAGAAKKVTVTEQKFVLLYEILSSDAIRTLLNYAGPIWAVSLPIVLIVHANQFCDAYSTIVWDRAFKNEVRLVLFAISP